MVELCKNKKSKIGKNMASGRGFTLAELLVVVAIIGLISAVLITNLSSERRRAYDTAIIETMDTLRKAAERDRDENGHYGVVCQENGGDAGNSILSNMGDYGRINTDVKADNGGFNITCNEGVGSATFAAWTPLRLEANTYWCIDWRFNVKKLTGAPPVNATECP